MSGAHHTLGPRLKAERERQGITLQHIANSTKIGIALLAALERSDVSQWPKGIFRRSFFRSYTAAIGVPFDAAWSEFASLFPDDETAIPQPQPAQSAPAPAPPLTTLRLTLAAEAQPLARPGHLQVIAGALDLVGLLLLALLLSAATGVGGWTMLAVVSITYSIGVTLTLGTSVSLWLLTRRMGGAPTRAGAAAADQLLTVEPTASLREEIRDALRRAGLDHDRRSGADRRAPRRPLMTPRAFAVAAGFRRRPAHHGRRPAAAPERDHPRPS